MTFDEAIEELKKGKIIKHKAFTLNGEPTVLVFIISQDLIKSNEWYVMEEKQE